MGDVAELGAHPRGDDDRQSFTSRDRRARQHHVALLGARVMRGFLIRACIAASWDGFACQRGVVDAHVERFDQAAVGGHLITLGQRNHIARNQRRGGQIADDPIAPHTHRRRKQPLKRLECLVSPSLLPEREHAVDQDDRDDRGGERGHAIPRAPRFSEDRQTGGHPEDDREEMRELCE